MNEHLVYLRKVSNYPTLRFLNLMVFKIGFLIGCLYVICPLSLYMYNQTEKDRVLSKLSDSDRKAFEKLQGEKTVGFGDLEKVVFFLLYFISVFIYFVECIYFNNIYNFLLLFNNIFNISKEW